MSDPSPFPTHFLWGAATSAYQIEGSPLADGAGPSIWHEFAHTPDRVHANDTGEASRLADRTARISAECKWRNIERDCRG